MAAGAGNFSQQYRFFTKIWELIVLKMKGLRMARGLQFFQAVGEASRGSL